MDTKQETTFDQDLSTIVAQLPAPIRTFFASGKVEIVAKNLMQKYQFHIDQGAIVEREIIMLLLGLKNPTEFTEALAEEAKLTKIVINGIVQDVNNQIFVPLRKEEEKGGMAATEVRPSTEIPKVEPQRPVPVPTPPSSISQPASHFKLENKIPLPRPVPQLQKNVPPLIVSKGVLPPKVFLPRPATLGEVVRSVLAVPKPIENSKLLEDHEEPHIAFEAKSPEVRPRGNAARPVVAPENLPGVMLEPVIPEAPIPEVRPSPEFPKVEPQIQKPAPLNTLSDKVSGEHPASQNVIAVAPIEPKSVPAPITSYSNDPYREPIDEPPTE